MSHHWGFPVTTSSSRKGLPFVWRTPHISRQRALHGLPRPHEVFPLHDNSAAFPPCRR